MSNPKLRTGEIRDQNAKRNLPSWTNSQRSGSNSGSKEDLGNDRKGKDKKKLGDTSDHTEHGEKKVPEKSPQKAMPFSKLLEGVIFALSGFVNPERSTLRSQALEMGAEFRADWTPDCTLLICAFLNTPKFKQVEADCGTIVSKEWIAECYNKKKLIEIDPFLMHAGKPWRKHNDFLDARLENAPHQVAQGQVDRKVPLNANLSVTSKNSSSPENIFASAEVKNWASSDLNNTISWLESQEEKPEADEVKKIAAEGIITCLQDALEALKENKDIRHVMDQWMFVPRVVEELAKLERGESRPKPVTKKELIRLAIKAKQIYADELSFSKNSPVSKRAKVADTTDEEVVQEHLTVDDTGSDSDATVVMMEEEIEQAWRGS